MSPRPGTGVQAIFPLVVRTRRQIHEQSRGCRGKPVPRGQVPAAAASDQPSVRVFWGKPMQCAVTDHALFCANPTRSEMPGRPSRSLPWPAKTGLPRPGTAPSRSWPDPESWACSPMSSIFPRHRPADLTPGTPGPQALDPARTQHRLIKRCGDQGQMPPIAPVPPALPSRTGLPACPKACLRQGTACNALLHRTVPIYANATKPKAKCE